MIPLPTQKQIRPKALFIIVMFFFIFLTFPCGIFAENNTKAYSHKNADGKESIKRQISKAMNIEQKTQKKNAAWSEEKSKLTALSTELKSQKSYLEKRLEKTRRLLALETKKNNEYLRKQEEARRIKEELTSYLESVVDRLEEQIHGDMPFLMEERNARIASLKEMLVDPSESAAEKFRRVFESLQIETEYGSSVEVIQKEISLGGEKTLVDVFRLGRISLFFLTIDGEKCGFFDRMDKKWKSLPKQMNNAMGKAVAMAVAMARLERSVELVKLPLGRIVNP